MTNYLIFTTGRTGSTLLSGFLHQQGAGRPKSALYDLMGNDLVSIRSELEARRVNGVLGAVAPWDTLIRLCERIDVSVVDFIETCFPEAKYIYSYRRDRVKQAVSTVKHNRLDRKHVYSDTELEAYRGEERVLGSREVPMDTIRATVLQVSLEHHAYLSFFDRFGVVPCPVAFEYLINNKTKVCRYVMTYLGLNYHEKPLQDDVQRVHSELDDNWYSEYLKGDLAICES